MENLAVKLGYLSETRNNVNQRQPQNNQLEALHLLLRRNKLPQMKNTCKLSQILTPDGLFMPYHAWLDSRSYCWLSVHASREKKQAKRTSQDLNCFTQIYRVTMPVRDFKCNDDSDTTADEHQNRIVRPRGIKLRLSVHHIFIIILRSAKKSYDPSYAPIFLNYICYLFCLIWCKFSFSFCLYCLCLVPPKTNDESKGNTNRKRKKIFTTSNKRVMCKCNSYVLPICICPSTETGKIRNVNIYIYLTPHIISFLTVKELLDTILALNSKVKELLELIWVEAYLLTVTKNVWDQAVNLHFYLVKIVYYDDWLLYSCFFNKRNIHKSNP